VATIFHVDMDAFFVSVEELFDPSLKGKPVVVGGKADQRGVVSAASYAARKFGIHSAMPLRKAAQLCPAAIFVEGHNDRYRDYSRRVRKVLERFTPVLEMASIDEAYLDVTGTHRLHGPPLKAAQKLHDWIRQDTNLNCSIGISSSRMVSKVASDQAKPHGMLWIPPGCEQAFLAPLDLRKLPGIGKKTEAALARLGLRKVRDLSGVDERFMQEHFGAWGLSLAGKGKGQDSGSWYKNEIGADIGPKSISHEHTFHEDTTDTGQIEATLAHLSEKVGRRLRTQDLHGKTIQIKLRTSAWETITRAQTLDHATQLDQEIFSIAKMLFREHWNRNPVRLIGVHAGNLQQQRGQLDLLDGGKAERQRRALAAVDQLRSKFGDTMVSSGRAMQGKFKEVAHEALPDEE
jgi:DNA polymerase IV